MQWLDSFIQVLTQFKTISTNFDCFFKYLDAMVQYTFLSALSCGVLFDFDVQLDHLMLVYVSSILFQVPLTSFQNWPSFIPAAFTLRQSTPVDKGTKPISFLKECFVKDETFNFFRDLFSRKFSNDSGQFVSFQPCGGKKRL